MKIKFILFLLIQILFLNLYFYSQTNELEKNIITEKNEYGGKTVEIVYNESNKSSFGIVKKTTFFNNINVIAKEIYDYNEKYTQETGIIRKVYYFTNKYVSVNNFYYYLTKEELYFTDEFAKAGKFYIREDNYLNERSKKIKTIRFYPEWYQQLHRVAREEIFYNNLEKVKIIRYYNGEGQLINVKYFSSLK